MKINKLVPILTLGFLIFSHAVFGQDNIWYNFPSGLPESANRYIYVDKNDVKWIGGYNGGMHKFDNGEWTHYSKSSSAIADNDVRQSCFDTLGNLWITTWNKLSKFDTTKNIWTNFNVTGKTNDILYSVQVDNQNRVWVGTDGGGDPNDGLYMYDGSTWKFYNPTNSPLTGRWILQLKKDLSGKIWGCHYQGLFEINNTTITNHLLPAAGFPSTASASSVDFDSYNNKWVGVYDGGIGKFDGVNWTIYNSSNSPLPEDKVWSIAVDQNNVVWIGTENKGLVKFDGVNWTIYNTKNSVITNDRIDAISVDKLNNVWIAPSYGSIVVYNPQGLSGISGSVYYDINNNNVKDSKEPLLPNQLISINPGIFNSITNSTGSYHCAILNSGSYTAKVVNNSPYVIGTTPDSINYTINNSAANLTNQNFGIQLQPNIHDISIDYSSINIPRPGFSYVCNLTLKNIGSVLSDSITVKLKYDPNLVFDSTSYAFQKHQGDSLIWKIDTLSLFEQKSFKIYFHLLPNVALLGTNLFSQASVRDKNMDNDSTNNSIVLKDLVVGSFDPNDKQVEPKGIGASGDIPTTTTDLTYTIRFQNTGTASAVNIIVKDTISSNLDLSTIQMISSSHSYNANIKNGGIVWWEFSNINLPDSNSNEPASHGYVKYKLNLKPNLSIGTQIKNTGHIYFDFNPAIVTNQAINTITDISSNIGDLSVNSDKEVLLFPNPANNLLNIHVNKSIGTNYSIKIFNSVGKLMYSKDNESSYDFQIDISEYPSAIYCFQLSGKTTREQKKFIKIM